MIEGGELPCDVDGFVEGRIDGAGQAEVGGDRRQRGQHGEGVRSTDHVEVVDQPVLLAEPQSFGEEEEVELPALGGLREVDERVELDLAARRRVAPHRGVVDPGEVGGEMDLFGHATPAFPVAK